MGTWTDGRGVNGDRRWTKGWAGEAGGLDVRVRR
jgi:hypothetical protein